MPEPRGNSVRLVGNAEAAPATVGGKPCFNMPLENREGEEGHNTASQETCHDE